jgi:hypothetical protein
MGGSAATKLFDQDVFGCVVAEGDAIAVYRAQNGSGTGDFQDARGLSKSHFTHALAKLGVAGQLAYAAHRAGRKLASTAFSSMRSSLMAWTPLSASTRTQSDSTSANPSADGQELSHPTLFRDAEFAILDLGQQRDVSREDAHFALDRRDDDGVDGIGVDFGLRRDDFEGERHGANQAFFEAAITSSMPPFI